MGFEIQDGILIKYIEEEGITELSVPEGVMQIGAAAFIKNTRLKRVILPESVEIIGEGAFRECENLEYVEFPIGLQRIENKAFYKCKALKDVHFPEELEHIGNDAFYQCNSIKHLVIPAKVEQIYWMAFMGCAELETVTLLGKPEFEWGLHKSIIFPQCHKLGKVFYKDIGIDWGYVRYYKENLNNILTMIDEKDFSMKVGSMIKHRIAVDYYLQTGDVVAGEFIKKNFLKIIRDFIEHIQVERMQKILEQTDFVTKKNIDKCIESVVGQSDDDEKIRTMFVNYKNEKCL